MEIGNAIVEIINSFANLIVMIFQWFFDFFNSNTVLRILLLIFISLSLISSVISLILGGGKDEEEDA